MPGPYIGAVIRRKVYVVTLYYAEGTLQFFIIHYGVCCILQQTPFVYMGTAQAALAAPSRQAFSVRTIS